MNRKFFGPMANAIKKMLDQVKMADVGSRSAELSYMTVISIVPILAVLMASSRFLGNGFSLMAQLQEWILQFVTPSESPELFDLLTTSIQRMSSTTIGVSGLVATVVVTGRLMSRLDSITQMVWGLKPAARPIKRVFFLLLGLLLGLPTFLFLMASTLEILPGINDWVNLSVLSNAASLLSVLFLYYYLPNCEVRLKSAITASIVIVFLLYGGQAIYNWASRSLFYYDAVYGSLAFLPLFLVWVLIIWRVILIGMVFTKVLNQ